MTLGRPAGEDGPSQWETIAVLLGISTVVVGNVFFQALFLAFPLACRRWAWAFCVSGLAP